MTNPTPHGQVPEALIDLIDAYAETRHRCGGIYNARTEAARKAVIEALSGVQALSAAPAGWKLVPVEPTQEMLRAATEHSANCGGMASGRSYYTALLAASPTPPAEQPDITKLTERGAVAWAGVDAQGLRDGTYQQAAPKAAPVVWLSSKQLRGVTALHGQYLPFRCQPEGRFDTPVYLVEAAPKAAPGDTLDEVMRERDEAEDFINELLDEVLGADRPEWSSAYNRYDAMSDVRERITALHKPTVDKAWDQLQSAMAAPQQEAQRPWGYAWRQSPFGWGFCSKQAYEQAAGRGEEVAKLYLAPQPAPAPLNEREAFESTWENLYGKKPVLWDTVFKEAKMDVPAHSAGKYFYLDARAAWKAWQARAALAAQGGKV